MNISVEALNKILKRGAYYAAKWAGHENERADWEARYFAAQGIYADMTESQTAYGEFNERCGVTVKNGRIASADGIKCTVEI